MYVVKNEFYHQPMPRPSIPSNTTMPIVQQATRGRLSRTRPSISAADLPSRLAGCAARPTDRACAGANPRRARARLVGGIAGGGGHIVALGVCRTVQRAGGATTADLPDALTHDTGSRDATRKSRIGGDGGRACGLRIRSGVPAGIRTRGGHNAGYGAARSWPRVATNGADGHDRQDVLTSPPALLRIGARQRSLQFCAWR